MKRISYITHDAWWNSDLPIMQQISQYFKIDAFVFSSAHYDKHFPVKETPYVQNIYEYERKYRLKNLLSIFSAIKFLWAIKSKSKKGDIFYYVFGDDIYFNVLFLLFFRNRNTLTCFHNFHDHSDSPFYDRLFKRIFLKHFKNFHFQSKAQFDDFLKAYPNKNSFYTDMPSKDFGKPTGRVNIKKPGVRTFLFFGYIRDYKRLDLFIEAANNSSVPAHYYIAGFCKNWSEFESKIIDKEKFTCKIEFIDNEEIPDYYTQADFLVLPYTDATQSGPLHIAYQYHLPIIASNLKGFTDLIQDGHNGFIFETGNANGLRECIEKAASLPQEDYLKMKQNQKAMSDEYDRKSNNIGEKFNTFFNKYLS